MDISKSMIKIFLDYAKSETVGIFVCLRRSHVPDLLNNRIYQFVYYYANQPVICNREEFPDGGILFK